MSDDSGMKIGWRLLWGVVGAGLAFTLLSLTYPDLPVPMMAGICAGAGLAVALVGPALLELLHFV